MLQNVSSSTSTTTKAKPIHFISKFIIYFRLWNFNRINPTMPFTKIMMIFLQFIPSSLVTILTSLSPSSSSSSLLPLLNVIFYSILLTNNNNMLTNAAKPSLQHLSLAEHRLIKQDRAILHINLMNTIGICRDPRPLVVYPPSSPNKIYYPRGTLVHRCTDQTGCCRNPGELCRPETVENIEKVFFVNHFLLGQKVSAGQRIAPRLKALKSNFTTLTETLTFVNHTLCKCIKLAPDAIEHDDIQSVVSRPLVTSNIPLNSNSIIYHMIATLSILAILIILFFIYKFIYIRSTRRNAQFV